MGEAGRGDWWARGPSLENYDILRNALPSPPSKKKLLPLLQGMLSADGLQLSVHLGIGLTAESPLSKAALS